MAFPPAETSSDEIDLLQLWQTFWSNKYLILAFGIIALLIGALYAFVLAKPRYAVSVYINTPPVATMNIVNQGREATGLPAYSRDQVFDLFTRHLISDAVFQAWLPEQLENEEERSLNAQTSEANRWRLKFNFPKSERDLLYGVKVSAHSSEQALQALKQLFAFANTETQNSLQGDITYEFDAEIDRIERSLVAARETAFKERQDRILKLREALIVAKAMDHNNSRANIVRPSSQESQRGYELYTQGVRALQAELNFLETRENDDIFIPDLRQQETRLKQLSSLKPDLKSLQFFSIDGDVLMPTKPESPKKTLILVLSLILGSLVGVGYVLIRSAVSVQR